VIITRLPFEPPDRPLTQARLELIEQRGGSPFGEDSLPRAVMRFKQGIGRLIRTARDSGRIVVLDPRIVSAPYGALFRAALPEGVAVSPWPAEEGIVTDDPF
jgi:ATP-dependent DNA helicase DinG